MSSLRGWAIGRECWAAWFWPSASTSESSEVSGPEVSHEVRPFRPDRSDQNLGDCFLSGMDASRYPDTAIAVSRQRDSRQLLAQIFDALHPIQVPDGVLRHGSLPPVDSEKQRLGGQAKDLAKLFTHRAQGFFAGELEHAYIAAPPEETAQQGAVSGRAMRKLVMDKGCGQQPFALTAGHQEAEARRQSGTYRLIVSKRDGHRRGV